MKRFRNVVLLGVVLLVVFVGCGNDEEEYREPISFVSVDPPGGELAA